MGRKASRLVLVLVLLVTVGTFCRGGTPWPPVAHSARETGGHGVPPLQPFDDSSLVSTATVEGRLAVFDDVWETIQER